MYRRKICLPDQTLGTVLFFGLPAREEFGPVRRSFIQSVQHAGTDWCEVSLPPADPCFLSDLRDKNRRSVLASVFFESYPGQFSSSLFRLLRMFFPLAPILVVAGDLCEGEGRTGPLPSGIIRFYRYEWNTWGRAQWEKFLRFRSGRFALPPTASDEDYFLARPVEDISTEAAVLVRMAIPFPGTNEETRQEFPAVCVIVSNDWSMGRLLAERVRRQKKRTELFTLETLLEARRTRTGIPERIEYDSTGLDLAEEMPNIDRLARGFPESEIDLWLFAPRYEDEREVAKWGNVRILVKPFDLLY